MFFQGSLLASGQAVVDECSEIERTTLDERSWIDHAPSWLAGADTVFTELVGALPWRQRRGVPMYDSLVDEPRLTHSWKSSNDGAEPLEILAQVRTDLSERYGVEFDSIGFNLYRDGDDSVAWHGDRHRHHVVDPIVAIVSVGSPRPLRIRPRGGGQSRSWDLGRGDLFVMGGACQHDWEHCVPKIKRAGPRLSITFRHGAADAGSGHH